MVKCICIRDCYLRHESLTPRHYVRGEVFTFKKVPDHFIAVEEALDTSKIKLPEQNTAYGQPEGILEFDFHSAGEELLLAADYPIDSLLAYAAQNYNAVIEEDASKAIVVAKFVDARYRYTTAATALAEAEAHILENKSPNVKKVK